MQSAGDELCCPIGNALGEAVEIVLTWPPTTFFYTCPCHRHLLWIHQSFSCRGSKYVSHRMGHALCAPLQICASEAAWPTLCGWSSQGKLTLKQQGNKTGIFGFVQNTGWWKSAKTNYRYAVNVWFVIMLRADKLSGNPRKVKYCGPESCFLCSHP